MFLESKVPRFAVKPPTIPTPLRAATRSTRVPLRPGGSGSSGWGRLCRSLR